MKQLICIKLVSLGLLCTLGVKLSLAQIPDETDWMLNSQLVNDEAFTEPIEAIAVAAAEAGIIRSVNVKLGDRVAEGDLLFEMDMAVLEASLQVAKSKANTKARMRAAEIEYETKAKRFNQLVRLVKDGAGSPQEVEKAKAEADVARQSAEAIIEEAKQYALEVKQYEAQMERRRVRSPISGVVVDLRKKKGEYVNGNEPQVAKVVLLETLKCVFYLPTRRATELKKGDQVQILLPETDQRTPAVIDYVSPITSADSGLVRIDVLIDNKAGQFRGGVRARIESQERQSYFIPSFQMDR